MKKFFLYLALLVVFVGCGYKPTTHYAQKEIHGLVYTDVNINIDSSGNSVLLKDTMNNIVLTQLGGKLTSDKENADTIVYLDLKNVSHNSLTSDNEGYARTYRANVSLVVTYIIKQNKPKNFSVSDYYDYSVAGNATLNEQQKDNAVKEAVQKALKEILSKLAVSSFKE